jgi:hypothetical protein
MREREWRELPGEQERRECGDKWRPGRGERVRDFF